jgi:hypothetical protein
MAPVRRELNNRIGTVVTIKLPDAGAYRSEIRDAFVWPSLTLAMRGSGGWSGFWA